MIRIPNSSINLREASLADAAVIYEAINSHRDYLITWLPFVAYLKSVADEETFLSSTLEKSEQERNTVFIIENEKTFCGLIGLVNTDTANHRTEIGYWLLPGQQGKGIMTQCVMQLCQWAVEKRVMNRIQIKCAIGNLSSNAIPLRLGFRFEATEREGELLSSGYYADLNVYSILKDEIAKWSRNID